MSSRAQKAVTASGIVINEPPKDPKGKKRAIPEPDSEDEAQSQPPPPQPKKARSSISAAPSSTYQLRPRKSKPSAPPLNTNKSAMPKKNKYVALLNSKLAAAD